MFSSPTDQFEKGPEMAKRPHKENSEPREFYCKGKLSLDGVVFTIIATSQEDAERKASAGAWEDYDISGASSSHWTMYVSTVEENK